jgi:flagellar hook-associated protein 2
MASISSVGIGAGLDLSSLLSKLQSAEQAPLVAIQQKQRSYTAKVSAYGMLNNALSSFQSAAAALAKPELFQAVKAGSSAVDVLSATAAANAQSGNYAVNVTQLPQAQSLTAAGVASATAAVDTGGTITIEFGKLAGGVIDSSTGKYTTAPTFTADSSRAAGTITIDGTNNTLEGIRDAINKSATAGVSASIVNDGSSVPNRLVLTSKQTGETSSMRITVAGDTGGLSGLLEFDPAAAVDKQKLQQTTAAQNAQLTVNGIAVTSATSKVEGAVQGVTMTLSKTGASTLTVQTDTARVQSAVGAFVSAYNGLQGLARQLTSYDSKNQTGGALLGDSTLRSIQVKIRTELTSPQDQGTGGLTMLSQIGVTMEKDGTLAVNSEKLSAALGSQLSDVATLFSGAGGYGTRVSSLIAGFSQTDGALKAATDGVNSTLDTLGKQYTATSERIDATMARYKAQFMQLDMMMSRMNQTSGYLTQQFASMNKT